MTIYNQRTKDSLRLDIHSFKDMNHLIEFIHDITGWGSNNSELRNVNNHKIKKEFSLLDNNGSYELIN